MVQTNQKKKERALKKQRVQANQIIYLLPHKKTLRGSIDILNDGYCRIIKKETKKLKLLFCMHGIYLAKKSR
jgi:hypothetical protein